MSLVYKVEAWQGDESETLTAMLCLYVISSKDETLLIWESDKVLTNCQYHRVRSRAVGWMRSFGKSFPHADCQG